MRKAVQVKAGVPVEVHVTGDGDPRAELEVFITDACGHVVAVEDRHSDVRVVHWVPSFSGWAVIRVLHLTRVYNDYQVRVQGGVLR